jgi:hypothetical protein
MGLDDHSAVDWLASFSKFKLDMPYHKAKELEGVTLVKDVISQRDVIILIFLTLNQLSLRPGFNS